MTSNKKVDPTLYLVTDRDLSLGRSLEWIVEKAVKGGTTLVQLREKNLDTRPFIEAAISLKKILDRYHVPLLINDRVDVALASGADGVHLGRHDMSYEMARSILGKNAIIGLSVETYQQAEQISKLDADYIAISPVYTTPTKEELTHQLGLEGVRHITGICPQPAVGIGSIKPHNAADVIRSGADGIAVVSGICSAGDPQKAARELRQLVDEAKPTPKKISNIGEFGLIEQVIAPEFKELVNKHLTGIGDDSAIIPVSADTSHLHTTDMLVENTHFLRDKISPYQLGFKSLAVNLSDIAAMGGKPLASYLSIALPKDMEVGWMEEFMRGYKDLSEDEDVPLLGGDTTSSQGPVVINVGVTGETDNAHIKKRSDARAGDVLCVTGNLGDSAGGLQIILDNLPEEQAASRLLDQHLTPYPHVSEGLWLAQQQAVHAMIDVSDGIGSDLQHILKASSLKGFIELEKLPLSQELRQQAGTHGWNAMEMAISGGEDYVLLLSLDRTQYKEVARAFDKNFGRPLHAIGYLEEGAPTITYLENKKEVTDLKNGYHHF